MSAVRRALAVLPVAALGLTAPSAHGAEIRTQPCVPFAVNQMSRQVELSMLIAGVGFTPGGAVRVSTATPTNPVPLSLTALQANASGGFGLLRVRPPSLASSTTHQQSFTLLATDVTNPAIQTAPFPFEVVRFGTTTNPDRPRLPTTRVTYTARGFEPGKRIYIHFRFAGKTRRRVSLGVASSPCGIASRRMRALPAKPRYGTWTAYTNQSTRFSAQPAWKSTFTVFRRFF